MTIKCPKCSAVIDAEPDELGLVTCKQCGARLRSKQAVKVTVQGGASSSSPSLPKIDPALAAPADVDHVLARIDTSSPDETIRPGSIPKLAAAGAPNGGAVFDMLLSEIKAIRKLQEETLALLRARPVAGARRDAHEPDDADVAAKPRRGAGRPLVLLVDDDAAVLQDVAAALRPLATVKTAADGSSALATLAMERPTAIVLELDLAGAMPGRDLVNMIKATMEWVDIPLLLHTKLALGDEAEARQLHGADEIVAKGPGSAKVLAARLGKILAKL